MFSREPSE